MDPKAQKIADYRVALGGTRFLITVGAGIMDTLLLVFGKIDPSTYMNLTMATVAVFIAGHTTDRFGRQGPPQ